MQQKIKKGQIFFINRIVEYAMSNSQKYFFAIQEIHKCPFNSHITNCHHNRSPNIGTEFSEPLEKSVSCIFPVNKTARYINKNGVHADDFKKEGPFFIAQHINNIIE